MSILDNAKVVADLVKKYNDQELYQKLIDLRDEIFTLKEENLKLKETVGQLRDNLKLKETVMWERPFYWIQNGDERDGPYCQKCYDGETKLVRLQQRDSRGEWDCLQCGTYLTGPGYVPPRDDHQPYDPMSF